MSACVLDFLALLTTAPFHSPTRALLAPFPSRRRLSLQGQQEAARIPPALPRSAASLLPVVHRERGCSCCCGTPGGLSWAKIGACPLCCERGDTQLPVPSELAPSPGCSSRGIPLCTVPVLWTICSPPTNAGCLPAACSRQRRRAMGSELLLQVPRSHGVPF